MVLALAVLDALQKLVPLVLPIIQDAMNRGVDRASFDWSKLYGRSIEALRAQVDAQARQAELDV
jgi:hypothetical protein